MLHALGAPPSLAVVVLAYFVGQVANTIPIPGAVSGGMVGVLLAFGVETDLALASVLAYRSVAIWLPAPIGLARANDRDGVGHGCAKDAGRVAQREGERAPRRARRRPARPRARPRSRADEPRARAIRRSPERQPAAGTALSASGSVFRANRMPERRRRRASDPRGKPSTARQGTRSVRVASRAPLAREGPDRQRCASDSRRTADTRGRGPAERDLGARAKSPAAGLRGRRRSHSSAT